METLSKELESIEEAIKEIERFSIDTKLNPTLTEAAKELCLATYKECMQHHRDHLAIVTAKIQLEILKKL